MGATKGLELLFERSQSHSVIMLISCVLARSQEVDKNLRAFLMKLVTCILVRSECNEEHNKVDRPEISSMPAISLIDSCA